MVDGNGPVGKEGMLGGTVVEGAIESVGRGGRLDVGGECEVIAEWEMMRRRKSGRSRGG